MKKTREEKAITLIALIITIVVLLILAVVAINAVTGDGIIQHAVNAKEEYEKAQAKENSMIAYYEKYLESQGDADIWDGKTKKVPEIKDGKWYIYNCNEFKFFADFVNGDEEKEGLEITENTIVYLMANLDLGARQENGVLKSGTEWVPIGNSSSNTFVGTFEGNNHYIKGVYVNKEGSYAGVFGNSTNTIKNLTIKDSYVEATENAVGGIAGNGNVIENCHNINTSISIKIDGPRIIGGIAGRGAIIRNCTNSGTINTTGPSTYNIGGIVGYVKGYNEEVEIINCKNYGNITTLGWTVGGIVGYFYTKDSSEFIIDGCINLGNVEGTKGNIGGIVGNISRNSDEGEKRVDITNCYNTGNITDNENNAEHGVGGIIGSLYNLATIKACYNIGTIEGTYIGTVGEIIGVSEKDEYRNIEDCYYLAETTDANTGAMTETDMKTLNFANQLNLATEKKPWIGQNGQYPRLNWE